MGELVDLAIAFIVMFGPAFICWWQHVRAEGKESEAKKPSRLALNAALAWTAIALLFQWSSHQSTAEKLRHACRDFEKQLVLSNQSKDYEAADDLPSECQMALGYVDTE
jgi:uncharacterized iron-regulated membrane protein